MKSFDGVATVAGQAVDSEGLASTVDLSVTASRLGDLRPDTVALPSTSGRHVGDQVPMWLGDGTPVTVRVEAIYRRGLGFGDVTLAERRPPAHFPNNGFVVTALQAAWSAIARTPGTGAGHLRDGLYAAVGAGHDTDTVAAIAGAVLGARWGASAVPRDWQDAVHGWERKRAADLIALGLLTAGGGTADPAAAEAAAGGN